MITVTRLNGKQVVVNAELIKFVEATPDTIIKLTSGDTLMVKETLQEVVELAVDYGKSLRTLLPPT